VAGRARYTAEVPSEAIIEIAGEAAGAAWARLLAAPPEQGARLRRGGDGVPRDALRVMSERMAPRGWDQEAVAAALTTPPLAAMARLLAGATSAVIFVGDETEARQAWRWLEPARGAALAPIRLGQSRGEAAASFAWYEPAAGAPPAAGMGSAAAWLSQALERPVAAAVVAFEGGGPSQRGAWREVWRALRARAEAAARPLPPPAWVELYSPLYYAQGRLQAEALVTAIGQRTAPAGALVWAPRVGTRELAAALESEGGALSGVILAGAERPVAWVEAGAGAAAIELTVAALRAALRGERQR